MTTMNRGNIRSPGRTPPFILVGLLLIVGFLGYSYWSLSSSNSELAAELDRVQIEKKDIDQRHFEAEKNLENAQEELRSTQGTLDQTRKQLQDKEAEILVLKTDLSNKQADADKFQSQLGQCDTSLAEHRSSLETLKSEKDEANRLLFEEKQKVVVCNLETCTNPIKSILNVVVKFLGTNALGKALSEANFDAVRLMDGIQFVEPIVQHPKVDQQQQGQIQQQQGQIQQQQGQIQQQQGQIQQQQVQNQPQQNPIQPQQGQNQAQQGQNQPQVVNANQPGVIMPNMNAESQDKGSNDVANSNVVKEVTVEENSATKLKTDKVGNDSLVVQAERNKNIASIVNMLEKIELERTQENEAKNNSIITLKNGEVDETDKKKAEVKEENTYEVDETEKKKVEVKEKNNANKGDEAKENIREANDRRQIGGDNI